MVDWRICYSKTTHNLARVRFAHIVYIQCGLIIVRAHTIWTRVSNYSNWQWRPFPYPLPRAHAQGVKQSDLSVVGTKIARSRDLGIQATRKRN